jgi:DNA-binding NarL/FixJ family response regulator
MTAVNERVLREENGTARPEDAPMGLVWIKSRQQDAASLGLQRASSAAYVHNGREQPAGEPPSAVICSSNGRDIASEVKSVIDLTPNAVVLIYVPTPNLPLARAALGAGASGLLHAGMRPEQILRAVRVALRGETVLPRGLLSEWVDEQRPLDLGVLLSARQREILELLAEGSTNSEIAGRLFLSESTVKQHLRAAYKALGVRNRREAAALSRRYRRGCV